ncbi:MAG: sugar kinase [Proteobacteria bacterium]|nr:sugar kinase [Pseudomonadota bacterium]
MKQVEGLFVGLSTIDIEYLVEKLPPANTKSFSTDFAIHAGGPAYNAAIAFSFLGGKAVVLSAVGHGKLSPVVRDDADAYQVRIIDAAPRAMELPVSSVFVEAKSGDRTLVSNSSAAGKPEALPDNVLDDISPSILLWDTFYPELAVEVFKRFQGCGVPVVLDGEIWTPGIEALLPNVDVAICAERFLPPGASKGSEVFEALRQVGVRRIAITRGERPILYFDGESSGQIDVAKIQAVDTLAAGDIFHGAFSYFYARGSGFVTALEKAGEAATLSCKHFGPRSWMRSGEGSTVREQISESARHDGKVAETVRSPARP